MINQTCMIKLFVGLSRSYLQSSKEAVFTYLALKELKAFAENNLTLSQTSPGFYMSAVQVFWKRCRKRRNYSWRAFSPIPQCFLPVRRTFCHFHQIWNYRLQTLSIKKSLKFVVWKGLNVTQQCVFGRMENIMGQFLLFPQCFQKAPFPGLLKPRIVW